MCAVVVWSVRLSGRDVVAGRGNAAIGGGEMRSGQSGEKILSSLRI